MGRRSRFDPDLSTGLLAATDVSYPQFPPQAAEK